MNFTCALIAVAILYSLSVNCFQKETGTSLKPTNKTQPDETIIDSFEPVGCFKDKKRPRAFYNWIESFEELFNASRSNASIKAIIHACAEIVSKEYGFRYFGIQYVHECWSGANGSFTYNWYGKSDNCNNGVGMKWANFVYRFVQVNGSWSPWSPWQPCSATCGGGNRTRARTCTEPRPKWEGKDCIGMNVSSEKCNQHKCDGQNSDRKALLAPILGSCCLFLLCLVGSVWFGIRYLKKRRASSEFSDQWEVLFDDISLCKIIGEGAFGKVYSGELLRQKDVINIRKISTQWSKKGAKEKKGGLRVAVKMLRNGSTEEQKQEFLGEIELMKQIGYHRNILNLLACCTVTVPMFLVVEFAKYGDLRQYLRQRRAQIIQAAEGDGTLCNTGYQNMGIINETIYECSSDEHNCALTGHRTFKKKSGRHKPLVTDNDGVYDDVKLTPADLLTFAWQISKGMEFLSRKGFVHRDIAARNVLVCDGKLVKVADFGLSRYVCEEKVYHCKKAGRKLPIKWMSPEAIHDHVFTVQSDVWAYGVLLWEIGTIGGTPYPTITNQRLPTALNNGYRMDKPDMCSEEMYELMRQCWREKPVERPSFTFISEQLEQMMLRHCSYLDLSNANQCCHAPYRDSESDEEAAL